ncbi:maleylacetoacetate isomerase [Candidatus Halocynthiibacter alkanivorans]|uniref:maleylacetoacetate isomerase n=1 Tax=Candidatus Halocynthiibacter alkanivorans TaxID=2267619 RepID=UPI000DF31A3E|nr:maleylacetoacetate isomerase [Candidatus Halocynthiibacter alkanivorans]
MTQKHQTRLFDYWRSSASYRLRIALNLAGIAYETVPVDLVAGEQRSPAHLERNPQGLVPVLEIDGQRFIQSLAILDYLNETRDLRLLPQDAGLRSQARALAHSIAVDLHPVCNLRVVAYAAANAASDTMREDWMAHFIAPGLEAFEALLSGFSPTEFCTGDSPGLADICLMPQLYNAERWNVPTAHLPRVTAVQAACAAHPAFARAHPDQVKPAP